MDNIRNQLIDPTQYKSFLERYIKDLYEIDAPMIAGAVERCLYKLECQPSVDVADIADHLIANGVTVQKWIPVTEDKPKRRGHYFIAYQFKGSDMQFFGEAMWHDDIPDNGYVKGNHFSNEGVNGMYVTHWMEIPKLPLPEPPKGE